MGGPLADGLLDDEVVVCPLHGYIYDLKSGAELSNSGAPARVYMVTVNAHHEISLSADTVPDNVLGRTK